MGDSLPVYRVGVVGMGFGAQVHVPGFVHHPRFRLEAVAGLRPGSAAEVAKETGARAYECWEDLIADAQLDVVSVATAPHLHAPVVLAALARGRHVLCEKPMALDAREAGAMVESARVLGRVGAINHEFRFWPARMAVKERIAQGEIGDVLAAQVTMSVSGRGRRLEEPAGWLERAETGGGFLGAIGAHLVDSLLWWLDDEIVRVWGDLRALAPVRPRAGGGTERVSAEDTFAMALTFASGAIASVSLVSAGAGLGTRWDLLGTQGTLRLEDDRSLIRLRAAGAVPETLALEALADPPAVAGHAPQRFTAPFLRLLDRFAAALDADDAGQRHLPDLAQGLRVQRVLDAVRLASTTGTAVRVLP